MIATRCQRVVLESICEYSISTDVNGHLRFWAASVDVECCYSEYRFGLDNFPSGARLAGFRRSLLSCVGHVWVYVEHVPALSGGTPIQFLSLTDAGHREFERRDCRRQGLRRVPK